MFNRTIFSLPCLALCFATLACTAETSDELPVADDPAPGRLVDIGGYRLYLDCRGTGTPTVVIDAGAGAWSIFFSHIQEALVEDGIRTCTYDRAGLGRSDPAVGRRTSSEMADDLDRLLVAAAEPPPYVLVGHSLGGLNVRMYTDRHPEKVAGLVLAESAHEDQWKNLPAEAWAAVLAAIDGLDRTAVAADAGLIPAEAIHAPGFAEHIPRLRDAYVSAMLTPKPYRGFLAELRGVQESHAQVGALPRSLGSLPLVVVSAGNSFAAFEGSGIPVDASNRVWADLQKDLAGLSSRSYHLISESAMHDLQFSDPAILLEAIRWVVALAVEADGGAH